MIIRREQLRAFERSATERFEQRALGHIQKELPERLIGIADDQLTTWVRSAISRALSFDLRTERQIMCFLDAEALLGDRFYETSEHAWAAQVLTSRELDAPGKSRTLLATACSMYRDHTLLSKERKRV